MPKPRLTHEEKMAELRARGKEDSELLELLANANVGKAELAQLLSDRAKRAEVTVEKRVEEEARSDRDATGLSLADWGSATERRDDRPLRVQAEEIIAKLRLEHGGGAKGFVYFVESGDGEYLKIGYSLNPQKRVLALTTASCKKLNVIGWMPGSRALEYAIHEEFAAVRNNGEWFEGSSLLKQFINLLDLARPDPDFRYRVRELHEDQNAIIEWEPQEQLPTHLTTAEIARFFSVIESPRDRAIFRVAYHRGLRASELGLLQLSDYQEDAQQILVRRLNGSESYEYKIVPIEEQALRKWIEKRGRQPGPLFCSRQHGAITRWRLNQLIKEYCKKAGIAPEKAHMHVLKHSCGVHLSAHNASLVELNHHLGHKSLDSTLRYLKRKSSAPGRDAFARRLDNWS